MAAPKRNDHLQVRLARATGLLAGHRYGTDAHEQGYRMLVEEADAPGGGWAQWLLGAYHLQVIQRPGALADALRWLRSAAFAGVPQAIECMADLCLQGTAMPYSLDGAMRHLRVLADGGHAASAWQLGYLAADDDAPETGVSPASLMLRACALGFPPAYYSLGSRCAQGRGMARDPTLARALLLRAADAGYHDAREAADALAAEAGPDAMRWHARLKDNLAAAQVLLARADRSGFGSAENAAAQVAALEAHFVSVGHPAFALDGEGRAHVVDSGADPMRAASAWDWLCDAPKIGICRGFANREECVWLINRMLATMPGPGSVAPRRIDGAAGHPPPQAQIHLFRMLETDAVMRQLQRRFCQALSWAPACLEPSAVLRYGAGHSDGPHLDGFTAQQIASNRSERGDLGGQRLATFQLWLQVPLRGGETEYPGVDRIVRGEPGMALVHGNVRGGLPDEASRYCEREVLKGEKWLWRTALRARSLYA